MPRRVARSSPNLSGSTAAFCRGQVSFAKTCADLLCTTLTEFNDHFDKTMFTKHLLKLLPSKAARDQRRHRTEIAEIRRHEKEWQRRPHSELQERMTSWRDEFAKVPTSELANRMRRIRLQAIGMICAAAAQLCQRSESSPEHEWDMRPYDVQLLGGLALGQRTVAELATGEGKTLVATVPACLYALAGRGVHVVTANDYLARRDAAWMGQLYEYLGFSVASIYNGQDPEERRSSYRCDITYGTASEFGFDYLRDHSVVIDPADRIQRQPFYALVDEADSILIDEARVPLIISAPSDRSEAGVYRQAAPKVAKLVKQQHRLCNKMVEEVRREMGSEELSWEAGEKLYLVQLGQPLNRSLVKLKERSDVARLLEKVALSFHRDDQRKRLIALKEELYFSIEERSGAADLTDLGCAFLAPDSPEAFTLPPFDPEETPEQEAKRIEIAGRIHAISQLLKAYTLYERNVDYLVEEGEVIIIDRERDRPMPGRRWSEGLHQAVEAKERVRIHEESDTIATITVQNYFRLYPHLAGMTGTASDSADEFEEIYGLTVMETPTNRPCVRVDDEDRIFKTRREKYKAVVDEIAAAHATGQPVLVGTGSVEASELVSRMLKRRGIQHALLNAKHHGREAEVVAEAGKPGAVTISTNMAGRGTDIRLSGGVAELGGLYVIGTERHESRRVDRQLRGRCARQGDPGRSCFFVSFEDELLRRFGNHERLLKIMDLAGHEEGEPLEHHWLSKAIRSAQRRVETSHFEARKHVLRFDNVLARQRWELYEWRDRILDEEPSEVVLTAIGEQEGGEEAEIGIVRNQYQKRRDGIEDLEGLTRCERRGLLEVIDRGWREHLERTEVLREQGGLARHAQQDPLLEYRRSASLAFRELWTRLEEEISGSLFVGIDRWKAESAQRMQAQAVRQQIQAKLAELRDSDSGDGLTKVGRNAPCPCQSGKKYKKCCG